MAIRWLVGCLAWAVCLGALAAGPRLVQRDLTIELRQTEEGREAGKSYSVSSQTAPQWETQRVQVRNGEKATLRLFATTPMQWTTAAHGTRAASGSAHAATVAGVSRGLVLMEAGQSLQVQPNWPGGNKPVVLALEVQSAAAGARNGDDLPTQSRSSLSTTVTAPLGEWVTVASSGSTAPSGTYSSQAASQLKRLLQVRVLAP